MFLNIPTSSISLVLVAVLSIILVTRIFTFIRCKWHLHNNTTVAVPYNIPLLGTGLTFGFSPEKVFGQMRESFGNVPVRILVFGMHIHLISGANMVLGLFKQSQSLTNAPMVIRILENAHGVPRKVRYIFERDNTGTFNQPLEGSNRIEPHNRYFYLSHKLLHEDFAGKSLADLAQQFSSLLAAELENPHHGIVHDEWTELPDLYAFIQETVFRASTTALCGPHLFDLNPSLTKTFWHFDHHITKLFRGIPRWLTPKSYVARNNYHMSVKKWLDHAYEHIDPNDTDLDSTEWEEYFGARVMRDRSRYLGGVDGMTREARAGDDAAMIWGANANIIPCVGWEVIDIFQRPSLLARTRAELTKHSFNPSSSSALNPDLFTNPLLLSIYSEELRLRSSILVQRMPIIPDFKIGGYHFPQGQLILASSYHEHRDESVWNTKDGEHPVDEFWSDRFLIYPSDPTSGPRKLSSSSPPPPSSSTTAPPKFTTAPVSTSFIPYGGGAKICPGRFYAKHEALIAMALFVSMFDIEIAFTNGNRKSKGKGRGMEKGKGKGTETEVGNAGTGPSMDMKYFAFGVMPPKEKVPCRIRRRAM